MKKQFRIAIIADIPQIRDLSKVMVLAFGAENVKSSANPADLTGILKSLRPTTLIIAPDLFEVCGIKPSDINLLKKQLKYRILAIYPTETSLETRERFQDLMPEKEYIFPTDYLTIVSDIPRICTQKYTHRKAPLKEKTDETLEQIFRNCGFRCTTKGFLFLKEALICLYFDPDLHKSGGATKIYQRLSDKYGTSPRIVERSILRFLENSWSYATEQALREQLSIPEFYNFLPMSFGRFTQIFNTYYTIKYGDPEKLLSPHKSNQD